MTERTNKLDKYVKEKYELYSSEFEKKLENATTTEEQLHAYAAYTGRLQGLLDGLTIGVE